MDPKGHQEARTANYREVTVELCSRTRRAARIEYTSRATPSSPREALGIDAESWGTVAQWQSSATERERDDSAAFHPLDARRRVNSTQTVGNLNHAAAMTRIFNRLLRLLEMTTKKKAIQARVLREDTCVINHWSGSLPHSSVGGSTSSEHETVGPCRTSYSARGDAKCCRTELHL